MISLSLSILTKFDSRLKYLISCNVSTVPVKEVGNYRQDTLYLRMNYKLLSPRSIDFCCLEISCNYRRFLCRLSTVNSIRLLNRTRISIFFVRQINVCERKNIQKTKNLVLVLINFYVTLLYNY